MSVTTKEFGVSLEMYMLEQKMRNARIDEVRSKSETGQQTWETSQVQQAVEEVHGAETAQDAGTETILSHIRRLNATKAMEDRTARTATSCEEQTQ